MTPSSGDFGAHPASAGRTRCGGDAQSSGCCEPDARSDGPLGFAYPADEAVAYVRYHAQRFHHLIRVARQLRPAAATRVLDIGRSRLTTLLADIYDDVTSLGMPYETAAGFQGYLTPRDGRCLRHLGFNLNCLRTGEQLPEAEPFDLIVFAEVIEHLYTAPELVLPALRARLKPGGHIICQMPNAAGLQKRLALLAGHNPFERIRVRRDDFGHYREYTRRELLELGASTGLDVVSHEYANYFGLPSRSAVRHAANAALIALSAVVPSFARGQTIIYRAY